MSQQLEKQTILMLKMDEDIEALHSRINEYDRSASSNRLHQI